MKRILACLIALAVTMGLPAVHAVQPDEIMPDAAKEARARELSRELRCMVCQNQSIDDSDAPLARDLRLLVRERLKSGDSDHQVIDYLVARYGQFVLLNPRFNWSTWILWVGPPSVLLGGAIALFWLARRRTGRRGADATRPEGGELSPAEAARLERLMQVPER